MRDCQCVGLVLLFIGFNAMTHGFYESHKPGRDSIFSMEFTRERVITNTIMLALMGAVFYYTIGSNIVKHFNAKKEVGAGAGSGR